MSHHLFSIKNECQPSKIPDSFTDFILSRKVMLCTKRTIKFYNDTLGKFLEWLEANEITQTNQITKHHIRTFLNTFKERGCRDSYIHTYARSIRTFIRFLHEENYIPNVISFEMPRLSKRRLPVLSLSDVSKVIDSCDNQRDKTIILMMIDTGIRRAEICSLIWGDVDLSTGICIVQNGKGKKSRSVILGLKTRRALIKFQRSLPDTPRDSSPLFQTRQCGRFTHSGFHSLFARISKKSGIHISAHAPRRTFVVLSLKSGMSLAHIQALMGHSTPKMTLHYAELVDDDLLVAHKEHGPVDSLL